MKYWRISGMGFVSVNQSGWHSGWDHTIYTIKAVDIQGAYDIFNTLVGHNSYEGFVEFSKLVEAPEVNVETRACDEASVWKAQTRPLRTYQRIT